MAARNFGHAGASKRLLEDLKTHLCSPCKTLYRCIINDHTTFTVLFWSTSHPEIPSEMSSFPSSPSASREGFALCGFGALPNGVGTQDVNVWLHCLQIYSSHENIAITWQKQYETNAFVAHLSSHSWEIQNLLTFLAGCWGRVGRCALLDVKVLSLLLEEKCYCQLNFWLWLKVFSYCLLSLGLAPGHAVAIPLLALTLVVLFGLSEIEPKPFLYSLCWSWGCEVAQGQFFLRACCAHSCSPTSPDLGTAQVSSPSQQSLHWPSQGAGGCGEPSWQLDTASGASCISW